MAENSESENDDEGENRKNVKNKRKLFKISELRLFDFFLKKFFFLFYFFTAEDFPNTRRGKINRKMAQKLKAKASLIKPENILKARKVLEKKQQKSIPRSVKKKHNRRKNYQK